MTVSKKALSEDDIRVKFIAPALLLARLLMVLREYQDVIESLLRAIGFSDPWVATGHAAALADGFGRHNFWGSLGAYP